MSGYKLQLQPHTANYFPNADFSCGRVSVIIGSNGSGKTKFLDHLIHSMVVNEREFLKIESNRAIGIELLQPSLGAHYDNYGTPAKALSSYARERGANLSHRLKFSFLTLRQKTQLEKETYLSALQEWDQNGRQTQAPTRPEYSLDKTFRIYKNIFPYLEIGFNDVQDRFVFGGAGREYTIMDTSEGERQVLALLIDLILNTSPGITIIVDEPENHLNPMLANRLWDSIEAELPVAQFVYATHSVSFAMRDGVESLFVVDKSTNTLVPIQSFEFVDKMEQRELLGAVPVVMAATKALCVEGGDSSFDTGFYQWLLADKQLTVVPLRDCKTVASAVEREEIWKAVAPQFLLAGVIDRDSRPSGGTATGRLHVLELHEAESYLCFPGLLHTLGTRVFRTSPTERELEEEIMAFARENALSVVLNMVSSELSLPRSHITVRNVGQSKLPDLVCRVDDFYEKRLVELRSHQALAKQALEARYDECQKAISNRDLRYILSRFPGKQLLGRLASKVGFASPMKLLNAATKTLKPDEFQELSDLTSTLRKLLGTAE